VFARLRGAGKIIVIGAPAFRLDLAKQFGADVVINIEHKSPEERLKVQKCIPLLTDLKIPIR